MQMPSCGSVFRNPEGQSAGALIDQAGLKGHQIGGAQISPTHANFIVNTGGATAADVCELISLARTQVYNKFGVMLTEEVRFVGF
jgi:UDP-N-acetylmuramate dehydrogenase